MKATPEAAHTQRETRQRDTQSTMIMHIVPHTNALVVGPASGRPPRTFGCCFVALCAEMSNRFDSLRREQCPRRHERLRACVGRACVVAH